MARRRFVRSSKSGRTSIWVGINLAPVNVGANTGVLLGSLNAAALDLRPFTVVRTRFQFHHASDQVSGNERYSGAMGFVVVSDQAVGQGVNSIPDPVSNPDGTYYVYEAFMGDFFFSSSSGFESHGGSWKDVDSKAMRKVGSNEDVAIVIKNQDATYGFDAGLMGRMLIKLH